MPFYIREETTLENFKMPTYVYRCPKCENQQDVIHSMSKSPSVKCSVCGEKCVRDVMAGITANPGGIIFKNPEGTSKMDNFEYRAKHNMGKAAAHREAAAAKSHVGPNPYGG
jgi:putative FmdB family regulatory protein